MLADHVVQMHSCPTMCSALKLFILHAVKAMRLCEKH